MKCPKCGSELRKDGRLMLCDNCRRYYTVASIERLEREYQARLDKVLAKFEVCHSDDTDYILELGNNILVCYDNNQFYLWDDNKVEKFLDISLNTVELLIKDLEEIEWNVLNVEVK